MIFTRIFILSLYTVYSNKYSFEQFLEFWLNQTGLANFTHAFLAVFIKSKYEFRVFINVAILLLAAFCGAAPFFFRFKAFGFRKAGGENNESSSNAYENVDVSKPWKVAGSGGVDGHFAAMAEIRSKLSCFRDLLDFSPCHGSTTLPELLILTLSDIFQRYPEIKPVVPEFKDAPFHKALKVFCDSLKSLGDLWTSEKWMVQCSYDSSTRLENIELERIALLMLEDFIRLARVRLSDEMDDDDDDDDVDVDVDDDDVRDYSPASNPFAEALYDSYSDTTSFPGSPMTPTSVLPGSWRSSSPSEKGSGSGLYSPPVVLPFRVQAVGKMSPVDVKRLSFHVVPKYSVLMNTERAFEVLHRSSYHQDDEVMEMIDVVIHTPQMEAHNAETAASFDGIVGLLPSNVAEEVVHLPCPPPPPPPPLPPAPALVNSPPPPPPPPPPTGRSENSVPLISTSPPPPPPPMTASRNGAALPPPPPPMAASVPKGSGSAPPPPPGGAFLRTKKLATKLKRSSQMGALYRILKGKLEGLNSAGRSSGRRAKVGGASAGGKQGMADALAEMTKRSSYFLQIEEDVKTYGGVIQELKSTITSFQTSDMTELLKFHKQVESHLEKLTDETQVLARFEEFPSKKLEVIRMAAALHLKLDSIISTLQSWQIVTPVGKLLDKAEAYFSKIKVELDALERTKDEDMKRFQSHKINFDFGILVRIKELMVDVSSSCMELALKEKRQALAEGRKNGGTAKILWRAFQFAFRVYTFAGGHDDRADELTREVAHEIETQN